MFLIILMFVGVLLFPVSMLGSLVGVFLFRGIGWRIASALPVVAAVTWIFAVLLPDIASDPTSHNLLPFEVGILFVPAGPYMLLLTGAYHYFRRPPKVSLNDTLGPLTGDTIEIR